MSKFFIRRPIVAIVIAIITVIVGMVSMLTLPTAQYPNIVPPEIMVQATYPGADAKTLAQAVSTPIEQQMNGVDNMLYMYSVNANNGQATVYVDFDVKTNPDTDQVLSQLRVSQAQSQLPPQVNTAGLVVQKSLTSPLMLIGLSSPDGKYDVNFLTNYAIINLQDELTRVPGVARIQVFGGQYALRVWVNPDQLAKLGVTATDVINAIQVQNNVNPAGQIGGEPVPNGQQFTFTVRTQGRLVTPEEFGKIVIRSNPDGSVLHLGDVARVELGSQTYNLTARYNNAPAGIMAVYQLPASNAVETAAAVTKRLHQLSATFPQGMRYDIPLDTTKAVTAGIHDIVVTLGLALLLVILVVFVFLQGWRATLIPLMAVPVSLIGTFIVFPFLGFSINTLSLFGLVLAIGLVVDDAIIVVEAVEHHIDEGLSPRDAAFRAMEEVGGPVVAIALILAAVFIPTAAIPGITGRLYQQFAITIAISVLISAFNALTLSPALAALLLKPKSEERHRGPLAWFFTRFNRFFGRTTDKYVSTSGILVHKSGFAMVALGAVAVLAVSDWRTPAHRLPAPGRSRLLVRCNAVAGCGFAAAHRCRCTASEQRPAADPGHSERGRCGRLQPADADAEHEHRILLRNLEAMGSAQVARGTDPGHPGECAAEALWGKGGAGVFIPSARDSRHRNLGWRNHDPAGSLRQRRSRLPHEECVRVSWRGVEAAGDCGSGALLPSGRTATLCRRGSRQGFATTS